MVSSALQRVLDWFFDPYTGIKESPAPTFKLEPISFQAFPTVDGLSQPNSKNRSFMKYTNLEK